MRLNRVEFALMNNPIRAAVQRRIEAKRLLEMGGAVQGGRALEIGCGRGVGVEIILDLFGAERVDAFDLDSRMVARARRRLRTRGEQVRLWTGDVTSIPAEDDTYDAVFDFAIIHHIPLWRSALAEVSRVLKPGGRFYGDEILRKIVLNPMTRILFRHPTENRFSAKDFQVALGEAGFTTIEWQDWWDCFAWFVARK